MVMLMSLFILSTTNASKAMRINVSGTGRISGNIRSATSYLPLEFVTITLFSAIDSSMVAGTISNVQGNFFISMLEQGEYFLEISEHGFEPRQIGDLSVKAVETKICLNEILLKPASTAEKKHSKLFKIKL